MSTFQRSHVCGTCSKSFKRLAALENHERLSHRSNEDLIKACQQRAPSKKSNNIKVIRRDEGKRSGGLAKGNGGKGQRPTIVNCRDEGKISQSHGGITKGNGGKGQRPTVINDGRGSKIEGSIKTEDICMFDVQNDGKSVAEQIFRITDKLSKANDKCMADGQNNVMRFAKQNTEVLDKASVEDKNNNQTFLKYQSLSYKNGGYQCSNCQMKVVKVEDLMGHVCRPSGLWDASTKETCGDCDRSLSACLCGQRLFNIVIEEKSVSCTKCGKMFPDDRIRRRHESSHCKKSVGGVFSESATQVSCTSSSSKVCSLDTNVSGSHKVAAEEKRTTYVKCPHCDQAFRDDLSLNNHILSHKELSQFDCFFCRLVFSSGESLKTHLKAEHDHLVNENRTGENDVIHTDSGTWYRCSMCPKLFTCKSNRRRHERWHYGIRPHSCDQCGAAFRQRWQVIAHKKSKRCKENRMRFRILQSGEKQMSAQPNVQTPNQIKNSQLAIPSQGTDRGEFDLDEAKQVSDESSMKSGSSMHPGVYNAQTSPTPASQASVSAVASVPTSLSTGAGSTSDYMCHDQENRDTSVLPGSTPLDLTKLNAGSAPLDLTKLHAVFQNEEGKSYVCQDCGQVCKTRRNLVIHKRIHTGERPYSCSLCYLTFRQSHHRKAHMLSKHGLNHPTTPKPIAKQEIIIVTEEGIRYQCHYCSKILMSKSGRRKHERWHLGLRPYRCNVCGNTFKQLQHLKKHQLSSRCRSMRLLQTPPKKCVDNKPYVDENSNAVLTPLTSLHMIRMRSKVESHKRSLDVGMAAAASTYDDATRSPQMMDLPHALGLISTKELEAKERVKQEFAKKLADSLENGNHAWEADEVQTRQQSASHEYFETPGEVSEAESFGNLVIASGEADKVLNSRRIKEEVVSEVEEGEICDMMDNLEGNGQGQNSLFCAEQLQDSDNRQSDNPSPLNLSNYANGGKDCSESNTGDKVDKSTPVQCHICGQHYKSRQNLGIHMRMHTGERPYSCSICNKKFIQPHHLKAHLKSKHDIIMVTPIKPVREDHIVDTPEGIRFRCQFCPKLLTSKNGRQKHERWHLGLRPHKCDKCGKAFKQSHHLKRHKLGTACIPPGAAGESKPQRHQEAGILTVSQTLPTARSPVTLLVPAAMLGSDHALAKSAKKIVSSMAGLLVPTVAEGSNPALSKSAKKIVSSMAGLLVPTVAEGSNIIQVVQTNHIASNSGSGKSMVQTSREAPNSVSEKSMVETSCVALNLGSDKSMVQSSQKSPNPGLDKSMVQTNCVAPNFRSDKSMVQSGCVAPIPGSGTTMIHINHAAPYPALDDLMPEDLSMPSAKH